MALFNLTNQLLQIDTGNPRTYLYHPGTGPWAGLGENQVLGQRYADVVGVSAANPSGAPAIYILVKYKSTGKPAPVAGPAPVYWVDNTFTTVTGVESEALLGLSGAAGYLMPNTTDISGLTDAMLESSLCLIQVGGYLSAAFGPVGGTPGVGNLIVPASGNFQSSVVAVSASANGVSARTFGVQMTALSNGICDVLVNSDII